MSLNEKYTQEELDAIPPFTGFHHNKVKEEIMGKAAQVIKERCDNLVFKSPGDKKKSANPSSFLLDEIGQMKIETPCYDASQVTLNHNDEINPFGKVNLWDFSTRPAVKFDYPAINKDIAEAFDMVVEKFKEDRIKEVIDNIISALHQSRGSEVVIMSDNDYNAIQSVYKFKVKEIEVIGYRLKIYPSRNIEDGKIEIY